jgi:hypothetical protein
MNLAVFIPTEHRSRYNLLGTMAREIGDAFTRAGASVNPTGPVMVQGGLFLFLNAPERLEQLRAWAGVDEGGRARQRSALVQFFVDHPLAMDASHLDTLSRVPHFRLLMPCADDAHWFRLRFPNLKHLRCPHGVPEWALCDPAQLEAGHLAGQGQGREIDVLVTGSIHPRDHIQSLRDDLPDALRGPADDMARFAEEHPAASFGQAFELCLPAGLYASDHWRLMQALWRCVTAALNRARRVAMLRALQGLRVAVIGGEAWKEVCTGTIEHRGEAEYAELPAWYARSRVSLAWGPTQFVHSYSERALLAMGGGCACVADERELVRRELGDACEVFPAREPHAARELIAALLADGERRLSLARRGRAVVEHGHLWRHRLELITAVALDAMQSAGAPA